MGNKADFLKAVKNYKKKPSKRRAISIWYNFLDSQGQKYIFKVNPYRSARIRKLKAVIDDYSESLERRNQEFHTRNVFKKAKKRWARHKTAKAHKADPSIFNEVEKGVLSGFFKLNTSRQELIELTRAKALRSREQRSSAAYKSGKYHFHSKEEQYLTKIKARNLRNDALQAVTVSDIVDYLQTVDVTINFKANSFFSTEVSFTEYKNMWEAGLSTYTTNASSIRRDYAERQMYSYVGTLVNTRDPVDRPVYSALNILEDVRGAATGYGMSSFTLKNSIKQRSTITPMDSFYLGKYELSSAAINRLSRNRGFDPRNTDNESMKEIIINNLRKILRESSDNPLKINGMLINSLTFQAIQGCEKMSDDAQAQAELDIRQALRRRKGDEYQGFEQKRVATFDTIESIVSYIPDDVIIAIAEKIGDVPQSNTRPLSSYFEVQVQGTIKFKKDVEEIVIETDIEAVEQGVQDNIKQFVNKYRQIRPFTLRCDFSRDCYVKVPGLEFA